MKAAKRDPLDWPRYSQQKYRIYVDNVGTGPAIRVTVPFRLTVHDIDEFDTKRLDELATFSGKFEILHLSPGATKLSDLFIDTTFYPAYKLELDKPQIVGLDGKDYSDRFTDVGPDLRIIEFNNKLSWDWWRKAIWEPSRPAAVDLSLSGPIRVEGVTAIVPVVAHAKSAAGAGIPWTVTITVETPTGGTISPFNLQSGAPTDLRLGGTVPGRYRLTAYAGSSTSTLDVALP